MVKINFEKITTIVIGVAIIVVDQITKIVVGIATIVVFFWQLWLVLRQLWLLGQFWLLGQLWTLRQLRSHQGVLGFGTLWWSQKCRYSLFCSPNRKWQNFLTCNWFAPFTHFQFLNFVCHPEKATSYENGTNQSITGRKMLALPVWRAKQEVTALWALP